MTQPRMARKERENNRGEGREGPAEPAPGQVGRGSPKPRFPRAAPRHLPRVGAEGGAGHGEARVAPGGLRDGAPGPGGGPGAVRGAEATEPRPAGQPRSAPGRKPGAGRARPQPLPGTAGPRGATPGSGWRSSPPRLGGCSGPLPGGGWTERHLPTGSESAAAGPVRGGCSPAAGKGPRYPQSSVKGDAGRAGAPRERTGSLRVPGRACRRRAAKGHRGPAGSHRAVTLPRSPFSRLYPGAGPRSARQTGCPEEHRPAPVPSRRALQLRSQRSARGHPVHQPSSPGRGAPGAGDARRRSPVTGAGPSAS